MAVIGLDLGTTGCKAVIFAGGRPVAAAYREYPIYQPHPGWAEQDPDEVWARVEETLSEAAAAYRGTEPIRGLGVSVQGEAVVPLDSEGRPLGRVILGMDTRTTAECRRVAQELGEDRLYAMTGMPNHTVNTLVKLMWLTGHQPDLCRRAARFVLYEDFLLYRLTGQPAISRCLASRTALYDLKTRRWSPELLALAGVDEAQLSPLADSGTVIGTICPDVAQRVGLPTEVAVVTGGHDQACGALGAGVIDPGRANVSTGTAEVMEVCMAEPALDLNLARGGISTYEHVVPGRYVAMTLNHAGGITLRWCRDGLFPEAAEEARRNGIDPYDYLLIDAPRGPSPVLCLPHFAGSGTPVLDPASRASFVGLTLSTTRAEMMKSLIDALTFELKANLDFLAASGIPVGELRAIGGGAKSPLWLQTKADVLGCRVEVPCVTEAACLGAGLLASVAAGEFANLAEAVQHTVTVKEVFDPDPDLHRKYEAVYAAYKRLYPRLKPLYDAAFCEEGRQNA
mgnify:CR=1 FL=1